MTSTNPYEMQHSTVFRCLRLATVKNLLYYRQTRGFRLGNPPLSRIPKTSYSTPNTQHSRRIMDDIPCKTSDRRWWKEAIVYQVRPCYASLTETLIVIMYRSILPRSWIPMPTVLGILKASFLSWTISKTWAVRASRAIPYDTILTLLSRQWIFYGFHQVKAHSPDKA